MKKNSLILLTVFTTVLFISPAFAEDNQERGWQDSQQQGQQGGQGMMMGRGPGMGMGKGMGMMGGMQKDSVVATSDGGVVILQGPRLLKYDKDLTLVKEVELPRGKKPGQGEGPEGGPENGMPPQDGQAQQ